MESGVFSYIVSFVEEKLEYAPQKFLPLGERQSDRTPAEHRLKETGLVSAFQDYLAETNPNFSGDTPIKFSDKLMIVLNQKGLLDKDPPVSRERKYMVMADGSKKQKRGFLNLFWKTEASTEASEDSAGVDYAQASKLFK